MFNQAKTAQAAARVLQSFDGSLEVLKLMKLLYLADRRSLQQYHRTITGDRMVSMPFGPVLSTTLNLVNGDGPRDYRPWDEWVSDRKDHKVSLRREVINRSSLDELSDIDITVIDSICDEFGRLDRWQLSDYTHDPANCPEWKDPRGSSYPIEFSTLFEAFGYDESTARQLAAAQEDDAEIDRLFASM